MESKMLGDKFYRIAESAIKSNRRDYDRICRSIETDRITKPDLIALRFVPLARPYCLLNDSLAHVAFAMYMIYSGRRPNHVEKNPSNSSLSITRKDIDGTKKKIFAGSPFERNGSSRVASEKDIYTYITSVLSVKPETTERELLKSLVSLGYVKSKDDEKKYLSFYKRNRER